MLRSRDMNRRNASAIAAAVLFACSSSSSSPEGDAFAGSCELLATRCHDSATELGTECHELGHAGDDTACGPRKDECLTECPESSAGEQQDSGEVGSKDGGADARTEATACEAYCACMVATCTEEPSYPFDDEAACLAACEDFSESDLACYAAACEAATKKKDKEHDCEHASGTSHCD